MSRVPGAPAADTVLVEGPSSLSEAQIITIAESIPALTPAADPRTGEADLRAELSEDWVRNLLPGDVSATPYDAGYLPGVEDGVALTLADSSGRRFQLFALPGAAVNVPPFATRTVPIGEVDVVFTIPEASQAVAVFVCGHITWQLVASTQDPRPSITDTAIAIVDNLDC